MLRQIHIFQSPHNEGIEHLYSYSYALALADDELTNVKKIIQSYAEMPIPGKTFQRPVSDNFQIFHRSEGNVLFLYITDLIDTIDYLDELIQQTISKFKSLFTESNQIIQDEDKKNIFERYLENLQHKFHSKIAIVGPLDAGKTTLYNILRKNEERSIMNFAKASPLKIDNLNFDIWDFQLDNFSLLWSKFISGSDLIIFLFDLSNYHLRIINNFTNLISQEGKLSKLLIIGNKKDLIKSTDIKLIKNELNLTSFEEISLLEEDIGEKLEFLISKALGLRKLLPDNFNLLMKEAINTENEGKLVLAISKYKELIKICNQYQDFTYVNTFKNKVEELQKMVDRQTAVRRAEESKKKFEIPGKKVFTKRIQVKPLPSESGILEPPSLEIPKIAKQTEKFDETKKIAEDLTLFKKKEITPPPKREEFLMKDIKSDFKVIAPLESTVEKKEPSEEDTYPITLQKLIEQKGSSLSLKLCEQLISELHKTLARPLTMEDVNMAADIFVKQESMGM